jgi:hypothetical protein
MNSHQIRAILFPLIVLAWCLSQGITKTVPAAENAVQYRVEVDVSPQSGAKPGDKVTIHVKVIKTLPNGNEVQLPGQKYSATIEYRHPNPEPPHAPPWIVSSTRKFSGKSCRKKTVTVPGDAKPGEMAVGVEMDSGAAKGQSGSNSVPVLPK